MLFKNSSSTYAKIKFLLHEVATFLVWILEFKCRLYLLFWWLVQEVYWWPVKKFKDILPEYYFYRLVVFIHDILKNVLQLIHS